MILTIAVIATLILFCSTFGQIEGRADALKRIAGNLAAGIRAELDHGALWLVRAVVCCGLAGVGMIVLTGGDPWTGWDLLDTLYTFGIAYGSFTPNHRLTLNKSRHLSWWYMDDLDEGGNAYDEFWWHVKAWWDVLLHRVPDDPDGAVVSRQIARIAYGFELFILALSVALLIFTNNT